MYVYVTVWAALRRWAAGLAAANCCVSSASCLLCYPLVCCVAQNYSKDRSNSAMQQRPAAFLLLMLAELAAVTDGTTLVNATSCSDGQVHRPCTTFELNPDALFVDSCLTLSLQTLRTCPARIQTRRLYQSTALTRGRKSTRPRATGSRSRSATACPPECPASCTGTGSSKCSRRFPTACRASLSAPSPLDPRSCTPLRRRMRGRTGTTVRRRGCGEPGPLSPPPHLPGRACRAHRRAVRRRPGRAHHRLPAALVLQPSALRGRPHAHGHGLLRAGAASRKGGGLESEDESSISRLDGHSQPSTLPSPLSARSPLRG